MHSQLLNRLLVRSTLACLALGCSSTPPTSRSRAAVVGGQATGEEYAAVLYVSSEVRTIGSSVLVKLGSGSLVAPNLMATALHVVSLNRSDSAFTCDTAGNEVTGSSGSLLGPLVAPEKIEIFSGPRPDGPPLARGLQIVSTGSPTLCQNDLAFIVLDQTLDLPTLPVHRGDAVALGDTVTAVGFGDDGSGSGSGIVERTQRDVTVSAVGQWIRTFTVTEGPCQGDSGGPALSPQGEIVGIFSSVSVQCEGDNAAAKYTDVSYFPKLVEEAFDAAGAGSPWASNGQGGADAASPASAGAAGSPATPSDSAAGPGGCSSHPGGTGGDTRTLGFAMCCALWVHLRRRGSETCANMRKGEPGSARPLR